MIATPAYKEAKSVCLYLSLPSEVFKSGLDFFSLKTLAASSRLTPRGLCRTFCGRIKSATCQGATSSVLESVIFRCSRSFARYVCFSSTDLRMHRYYTGGRSMDMVLIKDADDLASLPFTKWGIR